VPANEISVNNLPEDSTSLKAMLREVLAKLESVSADQEREKRRAEKNSMLVGQLQQRADDLYLENLRLQQGLERYKKATYGPRADRLSMNQLAQMLLEFAEALEQKPIQLEDLRQAEPEPELRRVKRRKGRRALANFENLPVNTQVYELSAEERVCPGCGVERKEIGSEKSWQIEYIPGHFERLEHVRKKYACASCEGQ
jgi:transposase